MQCPRCAFENPEGFAFCGKCGAKLDLSCPSCGFTNPEGFEYCGKCGASLTVESAPTDDEPSSRYASPETYTPKYLAERILTSKAALEGERKQVTVLFADLKGSMELLADRDPEDARALLDAVLDRMMEAVHRYEGTVNQVMGDGIMALFGAPLALEDHALRACYAALAIQNSINSYAEETLRTHGVKVQARVGLNSGEVVVRTIGNDLKMDYTAVGQTTHLAARMERLAHPGNIHLTADTLRFAEGFVQVEPLGPVAIKGMTEAVEVFELNGATSGRTRFQATAAGGLSRFVGRTNELEDLQSALEKAGEGNGQIFATVAEAGVGKSRLYWEFARSYRTKDWMVIESGSVSYGKATAYKPVIDLLKAYFVIEDADDHRRIREKVTGKVLTLDESLTPAIPPILSLLEVTIEDEGWNNLDPAHRRQRTLDGVKGLMLREAKVQPLCLVFEDLHWIDTETQALLDSMVESLPGARVFLLVNYRPEYEHGWANKTYYIRLRLDPLSSEGAEELLTSILGEGEELAPLKTLLIERTEGNPFYLEESVQTLIESGTLAGNPGAYRLMEEVSEIHVPSTVQAILAARIDRLLPEDKRLLQTASVIGTHVPYSLLSAIAEMSEEELHRGLSSLQAAEFIYETNLFPEREYTFKHALTHEVTYGSLVQERKRALHAATVEAIEMQAGDRLDENVESLAHHAYEGVAWEKAFKYLRQAASKAMVRSSLQEMAERFERALEVLKHLPESRETIEHAIDVRLDLRTPLLASGELPRLLSRLREAETLAKSLDDKLRLGWVSQYMMIYLWVTGDNERAFEYGQRVTAVASETGDFALQTVVNAYMGAACHALGDYRFPLDGLRETVTNLQGDLLHERYRQVAFPSVISRTWLSLCLADLGELSEAFAIGEEGMRIAEAAGHQLSIAYSIVGAGYCYLRKGDFSKAIPTLERGLDLAQDIKFWIWIGLLRTLLGRAYSLTGRHSQGLSFLEQGEKESESVMAFHLHSLHVAWLGEEHLLSGRLDEAAVHATRAIDLARERKERGYEAWALRLHGEIHAHPGALDADKAEDHYRQALALAEELGMRPLQAHCRKGLGALYGRTGREEKAREDLTAAMDMYREMEMTFWLEKAEEALVEVG
jgi:class 3 adenylate cyclase/tetratricopeptide (TPR) repeat protein